MSQVLIAKPKPSPSLEELNAQLRKRLSELIDDATADQILDITDSVSKLNASYRGNQQFGEPISDEEQREKETKDLLGGILNGEIVDK